MDFKNTPQSTNFEDHTNDTPAEQFLTNLATAFNPVTATRKLSRVIQDKLIQKRIINPPGIDEYLARIDQEIQKRKAEERAHPPEGFTINDQGIYIPTDDNTGVYNKRLEHKK